MLSFSFQRFDVIEFQPGGGKQSSSLRAEQFLEALIAINT
jgi:hypothetical protein